MKELNMRELCISNPMAARRLQNLCKKLEAAYPDKKVSGLGSQHNHWYEDLSALVKELGYTDRAELLAACGFEYVKSLGGRPSDTSDNYLNELKKRYPNGASFASLTELVAANPDLAGKTKTMTNTAQKLYGMSLSNYLAENGLMLKKPRNDAQPRKKPEDFPKPVIENNVPIEIKNKVFSFSVDLSNIDTYYFSSELKRYNGIFKKMLTDKTDYWIIDAEKQFSVAELERYQKITQADKRHVHVIALDQFTQHLTALEQAVPGMHSRIQAAANPFLVYFKTQVYNIEQALKAMLEESSRPMYRAAPSPDMISKALEPLIDRAAPICFRNMHFCLDPGLISRRLLEDIKESVEKKNGKAFIDDRYRCINDIQTEYCVVCPTNPYLDMAYHCSIFLQCMLNGFKIRIIPLDMLLDALPEVMRDRMPCGWEKRLLSSNELPKKIEKRSYFDMLVADMRKLHEEHGQLPSHSLIRGRINDMYELMRYHRIFSFVDYGNGVAEASVRDDESVFDIIERFPALRSVCFMEGHFNVYVTYSESGYSDISNREEYIVFRADIPWYDQCGIKGAWRGTITDPSTGTHAYIDYSFPFKKKWEDDHYIVQEPDGQFYLESPVKSAE